MKRLALIALFALLLPAIPASADGKPGHLYLCRSPLLAFDFYEELGNLQKQGITVTPVIAMQVCDAMKAGQDPQCIRVEADADEFKPIAAGWGGALALTDGKTKVWFHQPDAFGWVHPQYYVGYVNRK